MLAAQHLDTSEKSLTALDCRQLELSRLVSDNKRSIAVSSPCVVFRHVCAEVHP